MVWSGVPSLCKCLAEPTPARLLTRRLTHMVIYMLLVAQHDMFLVQLLAITENSLLLMADTDEMTLDVLLLYFKKLHHNLKFVLA